MGDVEVLPELKQIVGALLFGAKQPLSLDDMRRVLVQVAEVWGGSTKDFAKASEEDLRAAVEQLKTDLAGQKAGIHLAEVANGFRLENDVACGPWLRHLLERGRPTRLSRPALETLAIIAYRQPCVRSEIEAVRGVVVDQILRNLLEMQLIRIVGRSELPGRPWLFGTTQKFLEHFGLKSVQELPGVEELRRMEAAQIRKTEVEGTPTQAEIDQAVSGTPEEDDSVKRESDEDEETGDEAEVVEKDETDKEDKDEDKDEDEDEEEEEEEDEDEDEEEEEKEDRG